MTAEEIIQLLRLAPHPEGGHFRETFRDHAKAGERAQSTAIYFLLKSGEQSHWHSVDAAEGWHHYAGEALLLEVSPPGGPVAAIHLGADLAAGQQPQAMVPAHYWQRARSLGAWTLVGCTVAPGFSFDGFELAPAGFNPED